MTSHPPLANCRILITRAKEQAQDFSSALADLGASVIALPLIEITPPDSFAALDQCLAKLFQYDWIVFASTNAVDSFMSRFKQKDGQLQSLQGIKLAAIGPKTAERLNLYGLSASFQPQKFIQEGLVDEFPDYENARGLKILWPRTNVGRTYFVDKLAEKGAAVDAVQAYKTAVPDRDTAKAIALLIEHRDVDIVTLMSSQTARNLANILEENGLNPIRAMESIAIACIGPETASQAQSLFGKAEIVAREFSRDGLSHALVEYFQAIKH